MSVDFSQFFNGPIRDSLIAQVSGYLDISRQQATTAYDKAVALVIGAMARQAGKPDGAQALAAHIQNSQTQTSLTSSALSPTVLTNDQFAQIVTLGESEQAIILGPRQEAVSAHLEVATGLDSKAVGSLLSIVVPFVLSFLKNNITTESEPGQSLPVLLAAQAPHVAAQLDAPALAALGEDSLEGLFGPDALAAVDASAATSQNGKHGSAQGTMTNDKPANGWFKWVLTLAVVLAGAAWIKSCTQSDTTTTENAKPADQQQSATDAPAPDAATAPSAAPGTPGAATEPSANFPAPDATQSAGQADAPAAESAQAGSTKPESTQADSADKPATPAATESTEAVPPATDSTPPDAAATPASEPAADTAGNDSTNGSTDGPTYGQASDTMEPEAQAGASAGATDSAAQTTEQKAATSVQEVNTDNAKTEASGADKTKSDQAPAPAAEGAAATTAAPDASSATAEQAGSSSAATDSAAPSNATTNSATTGNAAPGKTTTFAEPAPIADKPDTQSAAPTPETAAGKTTSFAESDSSGSQSAPAKPQEEKADQPADTQSGNAPASDAAAPPTTTTESSGKTTTFGDAGQDKSASGSATQTDSTTTPAEGAGQTPVAAEPATSGAQDGATARVELERDGDALRIRGTVPDESARNRILSAAKFVDGHSKIEDELKVDSQAAASTFDDYSGLLSLLRGYHDVNVKLEQDVLTLTGRVSSSEEKEALTTKLQNLVGTNIQVNNQAEVVAPARTATPDVAGAPAALPQVQFASGSAQVDSRYHNDLDQYAQQLKASGKSVQLVGFADESGSEPGNETLSKRRAESVKAYLILRGVQAQHIQADGQGTQAPVADNTTEAGRAKNRRVEIREQ
ncbi:outer membrane protein OmpA-like peptidoglycan-associated protein [Advenella incenata]|uniref:Outer membrane protein OmpA-like peptidoglycan-associated protein n=1 Tax=Advenella incenata TaxID=267800 RepID=A0A4Q7VAB0_9BURK|nr:OmpA family protein [Advenella incenata]RZT92677.1 outer membrane protein OmpA-like peptidoglycan-associated protein [Advenella incenata]